MAVLFSLGSARRWRGEGVLTLSPFPDENHSPPILSQSLTFVGNKKVFSLRQIPSSPSPSPPYSAVGACVRRSLARNLRKAKRPCPLNVPPSLPSSLSSPTSTGFTSSLTCFLRLLPSPSASYVTTAHAKTVTVLGLGSDTHLDAVDVGLCCL